MSAKSLLKNALSSNQRAKIAFVILCYVMFFIFRFPEVFAKLAEFSTPWFWYVFIVLFPLVWFLDFFSAGFLGFLVLGVCGLFSERITILRHYTILCVIFLICAYPSFTLGMDIFAKNFLGFNILLIDFIKDKNYLMILAFYLKLIVWAFLLFGAFDMVYFWHKKISPPKQVKINIIFSIGLYVLTFSIYSLHFKRFIWI